MALIRNRGAENSDVRSVVAIPVKDEAERIGACLLAIARQAITAPDAIVLVVNNTTDETVSVIGRVSETVSIPIEVISHDFPPDVASAGAARRMAMERAAALAGDGGAVLTTDADGRVPFDWIAANLFHLRQGADAVAGRAVLDPADAAAIPERLRQDDELECSYAAALDEIAFLVLQEPWDPWPRHTEHSGASLAASVAAYRQAGGMPSASIAEDRKFVAALRATGARLRHAPEITVVVSGRTTGRAEGGMADTIRRRLRCSDPYLDDTLEPAMDHWRRLCGEDFGKPRLVAAASARSELLIAQQLIQHLRQGSISPLAYGLNLAANGSASAHRPAMAQNELAPKEL